MSAPCESCPAHCSQCAWSSSELPASKNIAIVRTAEDYGCVFGGEVVIDQDRGIAGLRRGDSFHPVSQEHGYILRGTALERDIRETLSV